MVDTQLCKLRDASGSFVLCFIYDMTLSEFYVQGNIVHTQFHKDQADQKRTGPDV